MFDRLEHFESELQRYGIKVIDEGCQKVEGHEERIRLYTSLLNSERWPEQREWVVLEHDAKCRLLVEQLRGDGNTQLSNARFWFLTYDGKLPRFALRVPDNGDPEPDLPFCVSPSAWVRVIRALTPRTDDFDRTVVDLLTSPFVGYRPGGSQVRAADEVAPCFDGWTRTPRASLRAAVVAISRFRAEVIVPRSRRFEAHRGSRASG